MATETAKFALELEDKISAGTVSAEEGLQSLNAMIEKDTKALGQMKKAMRQMQQAGAVDIDAYRKLKGEIDATQDSIGKARAAFINLGGDFTKVSKKTSKVKFAPKVDPPKGLQDMLSVVDGMPGPLSKLSTGIGGADKAMAGLSGAMTTMVASGAIVVAILSATAVALTAVAVATAKATVELLKYAAAQADAMRSERLRLEGLGTLRRWMRLTTKDSAQMSESINRVAERVPLARDQVAGYGQELHRLGIRGRAAEDALEALSIAQAVQGDLGRRRLMMLVRMAGNSEGAMRNLAERTRRELGGIAMQQMMSLSMITTKLQESFQALFADIPIAPLLAGLYRLSQLFSQNTESGRALRAILTTVLGTFIGELATTTPMLEYLFKELVILSLKVAIAFFRIRNAVYSAFGTGILGRILASSSAAEIFRTIIAAVVIVVTALAAGVAVLTLALVGALAPIMLIAYGLHQAYQAVEEFIPSIGRLLELFNPALWSVAGQAMIDGIVHGFSSGIGRLHDAVVGAATGAMNAFRSVLGIASPSTVFAGYGLNISQGVAEGIESGAPAATGAATNMMSTATTTNNRTATGPTSNVTTGEIHIHVEAGENGEDTAQRVTDALRDFFGTGLAMETAQ
jgi:hypothetical protein